MGCSDSVVIPGRVERKCREEDLRLEGGDKDATVDDGSEGIKTARIDIVVPARPFGVMATSRSGAGLVLVDEIKKCSLIAYDS